MKYYLKEYHGCFLVNNVEITQRMAENLTGVDILDRKVYHIDIKGYNSDFKLEVEHD